mmetsp:Transcript_4329/g.9857  ORF Transcript_4329/g.9857 Transcript_4329/m.9857 type:complete len:394 (-) Transcript_4329:114-1295(-)
MKFFAAAALLTASASAFTTMTPRFGGNAVATVPASAAMAPMLTGSALQMAKQVPHGGGELVDLMVKSDEEKEAAIASATVTLQATERQLCDVELIMNGGFSPITGFMDEATYQSVVDNMALTDGTVFGLPVVFDTDDEDLAPGTTILLKQGDLAIATVKLTDKFTPNKVTECRECYGTSELEHPGTLMVATERGKYYMGGEVTGLNLPTRDFPCKTPAEVRAELPDDKDVVAFQCRNPVHRAHYELFTRALDDPLIGEDGIVLVHPTCGPTQADDIPVQHMMIRKNFGCTHFIIGRDMAGSKSSITGEDYYGAYDAQDIAKANCEKLGVTPVPSLNLVFTEEEGYVTADEAKAKDLNLKKLSGTKFRQMLRGGEDIPEWFAFKSVVAVLRENQ